MTLIEVMVAAAVLMIGLIAVAGLIDVANKSTVGARERQNANNLVRELVEAARGLSYASISDGSVLTAIAAADPQLGDSQGGNPHTIVRNSVTYTVESEVCIMDDRRDGGGSHAGGSFCPDSVAENTPHPLSGGIDRVPEDYKRVGITTTWTKNGKTHSVKQTTLVNNPGSAGAPAVVALTAPALGTPPAQVTSATSILFQATTTTTPTQVKWSIDGAGQGLAAGSGKSWEFTWDLGAVGAAAAYGDGPYLVSAEAYDQYGVSGASRSITVTLNRSAPAAPKGFAGGRNGAIVEMEWLPNPERDLAGYRVYRVDGTVEVLVCGLSFATTCVDASTSSGNKEYRLSAYDYDSAGALRQGGTSSLTVVANNTPPMKPDAAEVTYTSGDAIANLAWLKPTPVEDVDSGDSIAFYRIYRDGMTINHRYTKVDATGLTHFFDDQVNGTRHAYYVSAVDKRYGESNLVPFVVTN